MVIAFKFLAYVFYYFSSSSLSFSELSYMAFIYIVFFIENILLIKKLFFISEIKVAQFQFI